MELLDICLTNHYFQFKDKFYQHVDGMVVGSSLPPVFTGILVFKENFEDTALHTAEHTPAKWLRYDNTSVVWSLGPARLQQFLHHFNSLRSTIKFTAEV
jgi:hypothetical protein